MSFSYVSHLYCPKCEKTYKSNEKNQLCTNCGSPLLVSYKMDELKQNLKKDHLVNRKTDLWRYHELLPVQNPENALTLGEGFTPIVPLKNTGSDMDIDNLYMKDEGLIPSGSFKSRGAAVGVSKAKEVGVTELAMPTNGNAGAAWSLYCAQAGITSTIVMPVDAPEITRKECTAAGASLYLVNG